MTLKLSIVLGGHGQVEDLRSRTVCLDGIELEFVQVKRMPDAYREMVRRFPDDPKYAVALGAVLVERGKQADARAVLAVVEPHDVFEPAQVGPRVLLGAARLAVGDTQSALRLLAPVAEEPVLATKAAVLRSEQRSAGLQNFAPLQKQLALERL